jgi:hypothetical protein
MRTILTTLLLLVLACPLWAGRSTVQLPSPYVDTPVGRFVHAIANAEGFGRKQALPTRYKNPGDLKAVEGFKYEGQIKVGKRKHVVFATDEDGWKALYRQINLIAQGYSKHYTLDMTLQQMAKKYAGNWRAWSRNVSHSLGVSQSTTLKELLYESLESQSRTPDIPRSA